MRVLLYVAFICAIAGVADRLVEITDAGAHSTPHGRRLPSSADIQHFQTKMLDYAQMLEHRLLDDTSFRQDLQSGLIALWPQPSADDTPRDKGAFYTRNGYPARVLPAVPMTGPYPDFAATCRAARVASCVPHDVSPDYTEHIECTCRALDLPKPSGALRRAAIVTVDGRIDDVHVAGGHDLTAPREYLIAIQRADGWWLTSDNDAPSFDLSGKAYRSGLCCVEYAGTPWFADAVRSVPGFTAPAIVLQIGIPTRRTGRPRGHPVDFEPQTRGVLLICGQRAAGAPPACITTTMPSCVMPSKPRFAFVEGRLPGSRLETWCGGADGLAPALMVTTVSTGMFIEDSDEGELVLPP
jgi:hypothetical protein